jgi:hypothetical protein
VHLHLVEFAPLCGMTKSRILGRFIRASLVASSWPAAQLRYRITIPNCALFLVALVMDKGGLDKLLKASQIGNAIENRGSQHMM